MSVGAPTILLVDDEFAALEVLALMLEPVGYHTLAASNGEEALHLLETSPVALIVTDYKMPKMDGLKLCARLHEDLRFCHIPVILTSATYGRELAMPDSVVAFFRKPLLFARLLETIRTLVPPVPTASR